jgi:glycosyltransferase involved in cell wall biosynthesis
MPAAASLQKIEQIGGEFKNDKGHIFYIHESFNPIAHMHLFADPKLKELTVDYMGIAKGVRVFQSAITSKYHSRTMPKIKNVLLPGSVDDQVFHRGTKNEAKLELKIPQGHFVVSIVGTISERKNQKALIVALLKFGHLLPDRIKFILYGGNDGYYCTNLAKLCHSNGLDCVTIIKSDDNPDRIFACTDILLSLSKNESYPRVILEALAREITIVAVNCPGVSELVTNDVNAVVIPTSEPELLIQTIKRAYECRASLGELAKIGKRDTLRFNSPVRLVEYHSSVWVQAAGYAW